MYDLGILFECLGFHAAPLCLTGCLVDVAQTLQKFSKNDNHQSIVSSITKGEIYTSAILEPLNHDPENPTTTAVFDDDKIIISGTKYLSEISSLAKGILISASSNKGVILALVKTDNVKLTQLTSTANSPLFKVELKSVSIEESDVVHEEGRGLEALKYLLQINMVMRSYIALGVTNKMTSLIASYTSETRAIWKSYRNFSSCFSQGCRLFY